jgi:hypothetical protein
MRFLAAAVVVVALASAGCGGGSSPSVSSNGEASKPAKQVLADALKAAKAASSVHVSGYMDLAFREPLDATIEKGKGFTGWNTVYGRKVDVAVVGSKSYIRAPAAFWATYASSLGIADTTLDGKWIEFSQSDWTACALLQEIVDSVSLESIFGTLTSHMGALTSESTTYKGESVVAVHGPSSAGRSRWVYVAATGTPYPVAIEIKGSMPALVSFDSWGKSVSLTAPAGAIEISTLGG